MPVVEEGGIDSKTLDELRSVTEDELTNNFLADVPTQSAPSEPDSSLWMNLDAEVTGLFMHLYTADELNSLSRIYVQEANIMIKIGPVIEGPTMESIRLLAPLLRLLQVRE